MKLTESRIELLLLYGAIAGLMALTFTSDLFFPLGTAIWVIYLFPVALCYLVSRPVVPLAAAAVISLLVVIGYFYAPAGARR